MKTRTKAKSKGKPAKKRSPRAAARKSKKKPGGMKMKAYASFDLYLADQRPGQQRLIRALRKFVARVAPTLQESVKYGNGCWLQGKVPVAYVYAGYPDYLQFGFLRGSSLADPKKLLHGDGQYVRHIKVRTLADIDEDAFSALLQQAMALTPPA